MLHGERERESSNVPRSLTFARLVHKGARRTLLGFDNETWFLSRRILFLGQRRAALRFSKVVVLGWTLGGIGVIETSSLEVALFLGTLGFGGLLVRVVVVFLLFRHGDDGVACMLACMLALEGMGQSTNQRSPSVCMLHVRRKCTVEAFLPSPCSRRICTISFVKQIPALGRAALVARAPSFVFDVDEIPTNGTERLEKGRDGVVTILASS